MSREIPFHPSRAVAAAMCLGAVLGLMLLRGASAQTPAIPVPSDLEVKPPAADVPANVTRFIGAWGRGAWDGMLPHVLVVETVDGGGRAQVVYAVGDSEEANVSRAYRRVTARIVGDLLTLDLNDRASVAYHIDGASLRGTYASARRRHTVTLTRITLAEAMAVPARVPGAVTGTTVRVPIAERSSNGERLTLEATLYRPAGDGPHPVLLFNHGSTGGGTVAPSTTMRPSRQAQLFVARGFAVLAPMRRGRGASDGAHQEYEGTCDADVLGAGLARAVGRRRPPSRGSGGELDVRGG